MTTESVFAMPISRTELYQRVNQQFYDEYPDAPPKLRADSPAELRTGWIRIRDRMLEEEVNRVYWARYPQAPVELDASSPEWEIWRQSWNRIKEEVMENVPAPEDVELQNAVSDEGELDLTYLRAALRETLVDVSRQGYIRADTLDLVIAEADVLAVEVGALAMQAGTVHGVWQSRTVTVTGPWDDTVEFAVKGWWDSHYFTGELSGPDNVIRYDPKLP